MDVINGASPAESSANDGACGGTRNSCVRQVQRQASCAHVKALEQAHDAVIIQALVRDVQALLLHDVCPEDFHALRHGLRAANSH